MTGLSARIEAEGERRGWEGWQSWERSHWTDEALCPDCDGNGCPACHHTGTVWQGHNSTWDREDR